MLTAPLLIKPPNVACVPFPVNLRKIKEDPSIKGISDQGKFGSGLVLRQSQRILEFGYAVQFEGGLNGSNLATMLLVHMGSVSKLYLLRLLIWR